MSRTRIKICGTTSIKDALLARDAGADAIGLIFARSRRRVDGPTARRISLAVGPSLARVGVFVVGEEGGALDEVLRTADVARLSALQLHGVSGAAGDLYLQAALRYYPVLQVVRPGDELPQPHEGLELLFDAAQPGSGMTLDWQALRTRFATGSWLAGGLGPQNVGQALRILPAAGVDAVSALEVSPGIKDPDRVYAFVRAVSAAGPRNDHE
ncbi:phosphoribosylanthranilate isomerase [Deinococcus peraridilitoris]|uniref:N-(5'-phosphoribosyl)anthranilate isomerase n=1 Tax=Deinococcus peraridilitoris (strain DSM 19664 / LMG 22246 / CIP 109416 / KR-200) TaxID=937777 RepID=L0A048_DEIPD|nr:phosphoribosylanthranilate isomerase [Deinococcus peraridilitoris]AFZ67258.1 phosphoribosylanthranilate isomerase [Deinococcus peraridilitoris DSM 19664]